ncbi:hypothetical protein DL93DRAFT_1183562 [Clavulina sp. PMI_390]|nr:hypothetical protein DL93DRAFT_1183562 [Clavulina sp. PMI_390]
MSGARRSARITAKAGPSLDVTLNEPDATAGWDHHDDDGVSEGEDSEHEFPAMQTRKRKAGGGRGPPRKRTKGKLSSVLTLMPNEVIGEICSYVRPADLLHLVQSSKIFAIFLLAQASAPIWRYARLNVEELPECPLNITEQQYACLIFGHYCQVCLCSTPCFQVPNINYS